MFFKSKHYLIIIVFGILFMVSCQTVNKNINEYQKYDDLRKELVNWIKKQDDQNLRQYSGEMQSGEIIIKEDRVYFGNWKWIYWKENNTVRKEGNTVERSFDITPSYRLEYVIYVKRRASKWIIIDYDKVKYDIDRTGERSKF